MGDRTPLTLDRERVSCLLLINTQLFKKSISIYNNILINQQALGRLQPQEKVLTYIHEKYHLDDPSHLTSRTPFPFIIQAPPDMPELNSLYNKLTELYPEAIQFLRMKMQHMKSDQSRSSNPSSAGSAPTPVNNQMSNMGMQNGNNPSFSNMNRGNNMSSQPQGVNTGHHMQNGMQNGVSMGSNLNSPMLNNIPNQMNQRLLMGQVPQQSQQPPKQQLQQQLQQNLFLNQKFVNKGLPVNSMNMNQQQPPSQSIPPQQLFLMNDGSPGILDFFN